MTPFPYAPRQSGESFVGAAAVEWAKRELAELMKHLKQGALRTTADRHPFPDFIVQRNHRVTRPLYAMTGALAVEGKKIMKAGGCATSLVM